MGGSVCMAFCHRKGSCWTGCYWKGCYWNSAYRKSYAEMGYSRNGYTSTAGDGVGCVETNDGKPCVPGSVVTN
jgi:hypothetical protein